MFPSPRLLTINAEQLIVPHSKSPEFERLFAETSLSNRDFTRRNFENRKRPEPDGTLSRISKLQLLRQQLRIACTNRTGEATLYIFILAAVLKDPDFNETQEKRNI